MLRMELPSATFLFIVLSCLRLCYMHDRLTTKIYRNFGSLGIIKFPFVPFIPWFFFISTTEITEYTEVSESSSFRFFHLFRGSLIIC